MLVFKSVFLYQVYLYYLSCHTWGEKLQRIDSISFKLGQLLKFSKNTGLYHKISNLFHNTEIRSKAAQRTICAEDIQENSSNFVIAVVTFVEQNRKEDSHGVFHFLTFCISSKSQILN